MKLLMIRHGDPDYEKDSLTEKGWKEARYLSERISGMDIKAFYVSPLGRARDTASFTLEKMGRQATECEWLREFACRIQRPDRPGRKSVVWDWLPQDWTVEDRFYDRNQWTEPELFLHAKVKEEYQWVIENFDKLLARHGYERQGNFYRVNEANEDTLVFFCHFGLTCVLASHLMGVSPMVLWQSTIEAPTGITTFVTEERRKGIASFRMTTFGDTAHLYVQGEAPAVSGRFCELYDNKEERHD